MNFEPQKFFMGVIDLFSIVLPGALLTYLMKDNFGPSILGYRYHTLAGAEAWAIFLFSSYLLGHFLFLLGSLLDDFAYDPLRRMTDDDQIDRLENNRELSPRILRYFAGACFKKQSNAAVNKIVSIRNDYLNRIGAHKSINAFQWCKIRLENENPEALATVKRFEADSKFFRSFIPVLLLLLGVIVYNRQWALTAVALIFLALAFWRYMEQRFKSTQQAYWAIITMEASKSAESSNLEKSSPSDSSKKHGEPTHAGGVVFRKKKGKIEYLLVQAKNDPDQWVLPKGHIKTGEEDSHCAIREVREETGVWARILKETKFEVVVYAVDDELVRVQFYLMEMEEEGRPKDRDRKHKWLIWGDAMNHIPEQYKGSKELLQEVENYLKKENK